MVNSKAAHELLGKYQNVGIFRLRVLSDSSLLVL
jgi:hypothetical protein